MGGGGRTYSQEALRARAYDALRAHPNLKFPEVPTVGDDVESAVRFAVESVARYLSPPKAPGENMSFTCLQVAESVRHDLLNEILTKLRERPDETRTDNTEG